MMDLVANHGREIVLKIRNRIGVVADMTRLLADRGLDVLAMNGSVEGENAIIRLVVDDTLRAVDLLRAHHYYPREVPIVLVQTPHRIGMLHRLTERLANQMIDVHHLYAGALLDQDDCLIVLHTDNNEQVLVILNELSILV